MLTKTCELFNPVISLSFTICLPAGGGRSTDIIDPTKKLPGWFLVFPSFLPWLPINFKEKGFLVGHFYFFLWYVDCRLKLIIKFQAILLVILYLNLGKSIFPHLCWWTVIKNIIYIYCEWSFVVMVFIWGFHIKN